MAMERMMIPAPPLKINERVLTPLPNTKGCMALKPSMLDSKSLYSKHNSIPSTKIPTAPLFPNSARLTRSIASCAIARYPSRNTKGGCIFRVQAMPAINAGNALHARMFICI